MYANGLQKCRMMQCNNWILWYYGQGSYEASLSITGPYMCMLNTDPMKSQVGILQVSLRNVVRREREGQNGNLCFAEAMITFLIFLLEVMNLLLIVFSRSNFSFIVWCRWQTPHIRTSQVLLGNINLAQPMRPIMGIRTNYWVWFIGSHIWAWVNSSQACELDYRIHLAITSLQLCWPALGWALEWQALWIKGRLV